MAEARPRRGVSWTAFAAGAVAMLALVMVWTAWRKGGDATEVVREAASAVEVVPKLPTPAPDGPHLPDVPIPRPK